MGYKDMPQDEQAELIQYVADQVEILFAFAGSLIIYRDVIDDAAKEAQAIASRSGSASVVFDAVGVDWRSAEMQARLHAKRGRALVELLDILKETELERGDHKMRKAEREKLAAQMRKHLRI